MIAGFGRPLDARPLFDLGQVVATPGAMQLCQQKRQHPASLLRRHVCGDFGELSAEDKAANRQALLEGARILSSYDVAGAKLWIITEADRSVTTLLLPEEY